ncbi:hypothetical protein [Alteromonas sp. CYL-A6]|uniref:hypothetical protein n=1 Tax=Alteromonas nitratireducens TaxID=3390813 RepID=UPI0034B18ED6
MYSKRKFLPCMLLSLFALGSQSAFAALIPVGLNVTGTAGTLEADPFGALSATTELTQASVITGPTDVSAPSGQSAVFTETGDGLSLTASTGGDDQDGVLYDDFGNDFIFDLSVMMDNTTTDLLRLTWDFTWNALVDANGLSSFAESTLAFDDGLTFLFDKYLVSDLDFGDAEDDTDLGSNGDTLIRRGTAVFVFDLAAGSSASLNGLFGLRGGVYDVESDFIASGGFSLQLRSVENLSGPPPVSAPAPLSSLLLLSGLGLLLLSRRKR